MTLLKKPRIDREEELVLISKIAIGEVAERILLISAGAGMGKSELLREFISNCPNNIFVVAVDFKNRNINKNYFLCIICETVGWSLFPKTENTLNYLFE